MMDNGGLSAGPQVIYKQGVIIPQDGQFSLSPRKLWGVAEDSDIDDVRKALTFAEVPSMQEELMAIIQAGMKMLEDATGLPMLLQGQLGKAPDTVGGMTMLNNNASAVLRRLARTFDDCITEPHIRRYYTWLLQYGNDDEKGDFTIDARGSSALVERDLQSQEIPQILEMCANPEYGLDPKKTAVQMLKSRKFDPANFQYDDDKWEQIVQNMSQKPPDPRVQIAQLKEQGETQRMQAEQQFDEQEKAKDRNLDLVTQQILEHIQEMKQSGASEITFAELKAELAQTAMKLSAQKEVSAATLAVDVHKHHTPAAVIKPPVQAPGRAANGQAFGQGPG